ncbi:hypothetical protein HDV05_002213 [Chytridiales sp. JEL 0842]|nr:hypothetical protein HDV05_002213 [Chytridiales sp. JEL 0842]
MIRTQVESYNSDAILIRILNSLSQVGDVTSADKELQTDLTEEDILEHRIRWAEKDFTVRSRKISSNLSSAVEERIIRYQDELDLRMKNELDEQILIKMKLETFKKVELAQMRAAEKQKYANELSRIRSDYEMKLLEQRDAASRSESLNKQWLEEKEKEVERNNIQLRQKLLEETNRAVMAETHLRNEAELLAKTISLEKDSLQRKYDEAVLQIDELKSFKERYTNKMQDAMTQYKIDLNREHAQILSNAEVERAKVETERMILQERTKAAETLIQQARSQQSEAAEMRETIIKLKAQLAEVTNQKDEALHAARDLQLQVSVQKSSAAVEFEIQSLKMQLVDAERMAEKRQEEYQSLLKSLMTPANEINKELVKARKSEAKWQRECQELVAKLDLELNRSDDLQRKYEDEALRNKELKRELAEVRLQLQHTKTALGFDISSTEPKLLVRTGTLPDPFQIYDSDPNPAPSTAYTAFQDPQMPIPFTSPSVTQNPYQPPYEFQRPGYTSPARGMPSPTVPGSDMQQETPNRLPQHQITSISVGGESHGEHLGKPKKFAAVSEPLAVVTANKSEILPELEELSSGFADDVLQSLPKGSPKAGKDILPANIVASGKKGVENVSVSQVALALDKASNAEEQRLKDQEESTRREENEQAKRREEQEKAVARQKEEEANARRRKEEEEARKKAEEKEAKRKEGEERKEREAELIRSREMWEYEKRRREKERREKELAELERIQKEKEEALRKAERFQKEEELAELESRKGAEEEQSTSRDSASESKSKAVEDVDEEMKKIEELENDPLMQRYMALVKEKRAKENEVHAHLFIAFDTTSD